MKWEISTIGEHCTVTSSKRFHLSDRSETGIPFYCSKEIIQKVKGEEITDCDYIKEEFFESVKKQFGVPESGDLLITTRGTYGIPYIYRQSDKFYFADGNLTWLKDFDASLDVKYLYYWILSHEGQKKIDAVAKGTAQKAVPIASIKLLQFPLPPIEVQHRIADTLSTYDDLIENNQKQIKLLEEAAQRLYEEWFIDLRFPGYETTPVHGGVPEGWERKTLGEIADIIMGQSPKSEYYNTENKGLPFHQGVGSYGNRFVIDDVYSTSYTRIADAGSILFSVRAPVGRLNITRNKIVIGRGIAALNQNEGLQSLLFYMLKERYFKDNLVGNGSIFASISKDELLGQSFIVPVSSIARQYDEIARTIDKKIDAVDKEIIKLTEARDRLLPKLMSGEIEV